MIAELGHFALVLALVLAILLSILPLVGTFGGNHNWIALAKPLAINIFLVVAVSYVCLTWAFVSNDFSVAYVANHSNSHLPLLYKISGVWGGHEGSLLLWALILAGWSMAVALYTQNLPDLFTARVLSVMAMIGIGIGLFLLLTSNPFARLFPAAIEGRDLNPLLQDIGLAIHPPMLYLGYVGFSVAFAFAIAAMIGGHFDAAWAKWVRPWTNLAWVFLTVGITLGSWWAYYELGWGGWWFWDPVENASFMPWLVATALIHCLAATEKRAVFKAWSILLSVLAFSLSLIGTFLVRSGVLTSVHAFANDPARGLFILLFLCVVIGGALGLYAWRAPTIRSFVKFELVSRESAILLNNVLLGVICLAVLLGTLYPLFLDALTGQKISVGPPYFDTIFGMLGIPMVMLLAIGMTLRWKQDRVQRVQLRVIALAAMALIIGFIVPLSRLNTADYSIFAALGIALGSWVILSSLGALMERIGSNQRLAGLKSTPAAIYGMVIAHIGVGVFIIGVTMVNAFSIEKDIRMLAGEQVEISGYTFRFDGVTDTAGPNYKATIGNFGVFKNGAQIASLNPEKRVYLVQQNPMTEAAIDPGFSRDLYIAMGQPLDNGAWAVRVYVKSYIRWIWLGALLMALGGAVAVADRRYRHSRQVNQVSMVNQAT